MSHAAVSFAFDAPANEPHTMPAPGLEPASVELLSKLTLHAALSAAQESMVVTTPRGVVTYLNAAADKQLQIDPQRSSTGWNWLDFWPEGSRDKAARAFEDAAIGHVSTFEAFGPTFRGAPRWWSVRVAPVSCEGAVISVTISMKDMSGFVWTEGELSRLLDLTTEADGDFRERRHAASRSALLLRDIGHASLSAGSSAEASRRRIAIAADIWSCGDVIEKGLVSAPAVVGLGLRGLVGAGVMPHVNGGEASLEAEPAAILAVVLDELSRNAIAHRGLAAGQGTVRLAWSRSVGPDAVLEMQWVEGDDRLRREPAPSGFGTKHMDAIVHSAGGALRRQWQPQGLKVNLSLPL